MYRFTPTCQLGLYNQHSWPTTTCPGYKNPFKARYKCPTRQEDGFLCPTMYKRRETTYYANQGISKAEPRHSHAVCTFRVNRPTSRVPLFCSPRIYLPRTLQEVTSKVQSCTTVIVVINNYFQNRISESEAKSLLNKCPLLYSQYIFPSFKYHGGIFEHPRSLPPHNCWNYKNVVLFTTQFAL